MTHDFAKRQQKPRSGRQLVGTIGLIDGCGGDRDRPRIAIPLVTRARGPLIWCPLLHGLEVGHDAVRDLLVTLMTLNPLTWRARSEW